MRPLHHYGFTSRQKENTSSRNDKMKGVPLAPQETLGTLDNSSGNSMRDANRKNRNSCSSSSSSSSSSNNDGPWWCRTHVRMPCSDKNKYGANRRLSRWYLIRSLFSAPQTSGTAWTRSMVLDVVRALHGEGDYWLPECTGSESNVAAAAAAVMMHDDDDDDDDDDNNNNNNGGGGGGGGGGNRTGDEKEEDFYSVVVPKMMQCALDMPHLFPNGVPLLKGPSRETSSSSGSASGDINDVVRLDARQIMCLLVHILFGTWPRRMAVRHQGHEYSDFGNVDMIYLMRMASENGRRADSLCAREKLKTLAHYFERMVSDGEQRSSDMARVVEYERVTLSHDALPDWRQSSVKMTMSIIGGVTSPVTSETVPALEVLVLEQGNMEDYERSNKNESVTCVDFANKVIGGGVLGRGCVQEEIAFLLHPECIVARLFMSQMEDNEAIIIRNVKRFARYSGYSRSYRFEGDYTADNPVEMCAIDAVDYSNLRKKHGYWMQYLPKYITRELNKCYAGFSACRGNTLCTGHWGCGAFRGDRQLKALIQFMAVAMVNTSARRQNPIQRIVYHAYGDVEFSQELREMLATMMTLEVTVSELYDALCQYARSYLFRSETSDGEQRRGKRQPPAVFDHVCFSLFGIPLPEDEPEEVPKEEPEEQKNEHEDDDDVEMTQPIEVDT